MLDKKKINELVEYWIKSSEQHFRAMEHLYKNGHYAESLFFGHLILEKALKALTAQKTKTYAPRTHNLAFLSELAGLALDRKTMDFLAEVNRFNMETRYPDERLDFYEKCTKSFAEPYHHKIITFYKTLCQKTKSKK